MAKLDLNSLKNLQGKGGEEAAPAVAIEAETVVEKPAEAAIAVSAGPKLSLNALKKSSGLSVSEAPSTPVESVVKPITIQKPILEKAEVVVEGKEAAETTSFFGMTPEAINSESGSDTDVISEPVSPIHKVNENIVTELEEIISIEAPVVEAFDETIVTSSNDPVLESSPQETPQLPAEFFPNLNVLEDLELQDVLEPEALEIPKISSQSIFAPKEEKAIEASEIAEEPIMVAPEAMAVESIALEPTEVVSIPENMETPVSVGVETSIAPEAPPVVDVVWSNESESVVLDIPSESMVMPSENIDAHYVEQVKENLSSERKGGLTFLKSKKVLIGLGVFAIFSLGFSFLAFWILSGVPEGKTNIQEAIDTPVTDTPSVENVTPDVAPVVSTGSEVDTLTNENTEVVENVSESHPVYQEGIDYQVIVKKKKKTESAPAPVEMESGSVSLTETSANQEIKE